MMRLHAIRPTFLASILLRARTVCFGALAVSCSVVLTSCRVTDGPSDNANPTGQPVVVVSLPIVGLITEPLLPEGMTWTALLPSGGSPHAFEPSPSHGVLLDQSPVLIAVHPHLDGWAMRLTPGPVILLESEQDHAGHDRGEENGHIWMDPVHVRAILPELGDALCRQVPETCHGMDTRVARFSDTLGALDRELLDLFRESGFSNSRPPLLTALPFIHPLLDRYDVSYAGPIQRVPGDMVAPSELAELLDIARDLAARALVSQKSMMSSSMEQIASDAGLNLVLLEPTGHGFDTYTEFIRYAAREINAAR